MIPQQRIDIPPRLTPQTWPAELAGVLKDVVNAGR
jgi:hypothetical protein